MTLPDVRDEIDRVLEMARADERHKAGDLLREYADNYAEPSRGVLRLAAELIDPRETA